MFKTTQPAKTPGKHPEEKRVTLFYTILSLQTSYRCVLMHRKLLLAFFFAHKSLHRAALVQQMTKMQDLVSSDVEVPEIRTINNNGCNFIRANTCKNNWNESAFY